MREPRLAMPTFQEQFDALSQDIKDYNDTKREYLRDAHSNYQKSLDRYGHLSPHSAHYLYANNGYARRNFARILFAGFERLDLKGGILHVTLAPAEGMMVEKEAHLFRPARLKSLITRWFRDFNMLGMIELGSYPNVKHDGGRGMVCFHCHLIAWGVSAPQLRERAKPFKERHPAFFDNRASAFVQQSHASDIPVLLRYQCKPPDIGYDIVPVTRELLNKETGEITVSVIDKSRSYKRALRAGEIVRADNCLRNLTLDKLLVGTGAGKPIAEEIKRQALASYESRRR